MARTKTAAVSSSIEGETTIGPMIQVNGRIEGQEDLRVEGRIDGAIDLSQTLYVEDGGVVVASVDARDVVVTGVVVGDVSATNSVTLNPGAKLVGDISTPRLIIADGAAFKGNVAMTGDAPRPRERSRAAVAARSRGASTSSSAPASRSARRTRPAASRTETPARDDDEITVVVKHSALRQGQVGTTSKKAPPRPAAKKGAKKRKSRKKSKKKKKPKARVPARKKRKVRR